MADEEETTEDLGAEESVEEATDPTPASVGSSGGMSGEEGDDTGEPVIDDGGGDDEGDDDDDDPAPEPDPPAENLCEFNVSTSGGDGFAWADADTSSPVVAGTSIQIQTGAPYGYQFLGWTDSFGNDWGSNRTVSVTVDCEVSFTAIWASDTEEEEEEEENVFYVTVENDGNCEASADSNFYFDGDTATITCVPNPGFIFDHWSGDSESETAIIELEMDGNKHVTAHCVEDPNRVTVTIVEIIPDGSGDVSGDGTYSPDRRDICTLVATPNFGYVFSGFEIDGEYTVEQGSESDSVLKIVPLSDLEVIARFETSGGGEEEEAKRVYVVTTSENPTGAGWTFGGGKFMNGQVCTVSAQAKSTHEFVQWMRDGGVVSTLPYYSFTVTQAVALVAHFERKPTYAVTMRVVDTTGGDASSRFPNGFFPWAAIEGRISKHYGSLFGRAVTYAREDEGYRVGCEMSRAAYDAGFRVTYCYSDNGASMRRDMTDNGYTIDFNPQYLTGPRLVSDGGLNWICYIHKKQKGILRHGDGDHTILKRPSHEIRARS